MAGYKMISSYPHRYSIKNYITGTKAPLSSTTVEMISFVRCISWYKCLGPKGMKPTTHWFCVKSNKAGMNLPLILYSVGSVFWLLAILMAEGREPEVSTFSNLLESSFVVVPEDKSGLFEKGFLMGMFFVVVWFGLIQGLRCLLPIGIGGVRLSKDSSIVSCLMWGNRVSNS